jgi:hypothetical protein
MKIDGVRRQVVFTDPILPNYLNEIRITNLKVGPSSLDIVVYRHENRVGVNVLRREGDVDVILR